jgi:hypothetical protein
MKFREYIPGFFSGYEDDLERIEEWDGDPMSTRIGQRFARNPKFHRFSRSPYDPKLYQHAIPMREGTLMAEVEGGARWWVLGFYSGGEPDLPVWKHPKT